MATVLAAEPGLTAAADWCTWGSRSRDKVANSGCCKIRLVRAVATDATVDTHCCCGGPRPMVVAFGKSTSGSSWFLTGGYADEPVVWPMAVAPGKSTSGRAWFLACGYVPELMVCSASSERDVSCRFGVIISRQWAGGLISSPAANGGTETGRGGATLAQARMLRELCILSLGGSRAG